MGKKFLLISPILALCFANVVYADYYSSTIGSSRSTVPLELNVHSSTSLAIEITAPQNGATVNVTPVRESGVFNDSGEISVAVATSNFTGYYLNMTSSTTNLTSNDDNGYYISGLDATNTTGYTASTFPVNTWGYTLKNGNSYGNYFGIGTGVTIGDVNEPTDGTYSIMKFGTKVDTSIPAGSYSTTIVYTAVPKPALYMQDVSLWGDTVGLGESVRAIDNRDMKTYWVTRIETDPAIPDGRADCTGTGNDRVCSQLWMTQNLDLNLSEGTITYNHYNTDLGWNENDTSVTWTPAWYATFKSLGERWQFASDRQFTEQSYDIGNVYQLYTDTEKKYTLEECMSVLNLTADECAHYHAGNLYASPAALAWNAVNGDGEYDFDWSKSTDVRDQNPSYIMPNSICPAGWRLPIGFIPESTYSDYDYLLYKNGITASHDTDYMDTWTDVGYNTNGQENILRQPLWIVHAGTTGRGSHDDWGQDSSYFTNTMYTILEDGIWSSGIQVFYSDGNLSVMPSSIADFFYGLSIRCVAR